MQRLLIADAVTLKEMENQLTLIATDDSNWTKTYFDPTTNDRWLCFAVDASNHGGGTQVLGKLPLPETENLIDLVITSEYEDEVFVAARMLVQNEAIKNVDFRLALIDRLEQMNDQSKQITRIEYTNLDSPLNRKEILGKSYEQIMSDAKYYRDIADRSLKLM